MGNYIINMNIIEAENISKTYGKIKALKNFSLDVEKGSCFALVGPNGAGKTTFVKSLLNLVNVKKGKLKINGINTNDEKSRQGVYFLPEKFTFFSYYTVSATLEFYGKMTGLSNDSINSQIPYALKKLSIEDLAERKLDTLSKGQLQRVGIANIFMGDYDLFIFDEPFSGLDPIGIKDLKEIIRELKANKKSIFINSHILSEMEKICDRFGIINKGILVDSGELKDKLAGKTLEDYFYQKVSQNG
jgi:ABC-2 type transport system ATP-binding protein